MKSTFIICCTILFLLKACSAGSDVAGNGSETGNPRIIGIATEPSGKPSSRAVVTAYPKGYSPFGNQRAFETITDQNGVFSLTLPDTGSYTIVVLNSDKSAGRTTEQSIGESTNSLDTIILDSTKTIRFHRSDNRSVQTIYAEGTPFTAVFEAGSDSVLLTGIPVGAYHFIDQTTQSELIQTVIQSSDSTITADIKQLILAIAPYFWNPSMIAVQQCIEAVDTATCVLRIVDASEAETILKQTPVIGSIVILPGAEQYSNLVSVIDTITASVIVLGSGWCKGLNLISSTLNEGVDSVTMVTLDGKNFGNHPLLQSLGITSVQPLQIYQQSAYLSWRIPADNAIILAYQSDYPDHVYAFAYDSGDGMANATAPGRRIALPFIEGELTLEGKVLYQNVLKWGTN